MCLAIPGKVVKIEGDKASVQYDEGIINKANLSLVEAKVGDYVLVHAGFAIKVLSEEDAMESLEVWHQLLEAEDS